MEIQITRKRIKTYRVLLASVLQRPSKFDGLLSFLTLLLGTFFYLLTLPALSVDNSFLGFAVKRPQNETVPKKTSMAFAVGGVKQFSVSNKGVCVAF